ERHERMLLGVSVEIVNDQVYRLRMDRAGGNVDDPVTLRYIETRRYLAPGPPHHQLDARSIAQPTRRWGNRRHLELSQHRIATECVNDPLPLADELLGVG